MKKTLLYGAQGHRNLGDDYIYITVKTWLNQHGVETYTAFTGGKDYYFNFKDDNIFNITWCKYVENENKIHKLFRKVNQYSIFLKNKVIAEFDALIFMGGGYTNEKFGIGGFVTMALLTHAFFKLKKPIFIMGHTVGPANSYWAQKLIRYIYGHATMVFVREKYSLAFLKKLDVNACLTGDDVMLNRLNESSNMQGYLLVNYKDFVTDNYAQYKAAYFQLVSYLASQVNNCVIVVPFNSDMESNEYKENYEFARFLSKMNIPAKFECPKTIEELDKLISGAQTIIGMAYHSIALGLLYRKNVISFYFGEYYKIKMEGLLDLYNLSQTRLFALDQIDSLLMEDDGQIDYIVKLCKEELSGEAKKLIKIRENEVENSWNEILFNI